MHNWYGIETEAAFRRREWERMVAADARAALAVAPNGRMRWSQLPHLALGRLRSLTAPRLALASPLEPDCRTAAC